MQSVLDLLASAALSLAFLMLLFIPMERVFSANPKQALLRPYWLTDLLYFIGQYLLWTWLVYTILEAGQENLHGLIPDSWQNSVAAWPFWLQLCIAILLSDLIIYWGHRLQHHVPILWRFHKVHHSAEHLDWLAAHREHPLDSLYTVGLINLPIFILGLPIESMAGLIAFRGIWAVYIHSNVRLNIGPLKMLIGSPELHHWHHSVNKHAGNYANLSPIMDIIFGTYSCPPAEPEEYGISESFPKTYGLQLLVPLLPKSLSKKLLRQSE